MECAYIPEMVFVIHWAHTEGSDLEAVIIQKILGHILSSSLMPEGSLPRGVQNLHRSDKVEYGK